MVNMFDNCRKNKKIYFGMLTKIPLNDKIIRLRELRKGEILQNETQNQNSNEFVFNNRIAVADGVNNFTV